MPPANRSTSGAMRPLVMLHGGLSSRMDWIALTPTLAAGRELLVIDTRGHGDSTLEDGSFSYSQFASDVIRVLDHLQIDTFDMLGWSDGANTALSLAYQYPARTGYTIIISANIDPSGLTPKAREMIARIDSNGWSLTRLLHWVLSSDKGNWPLLVTKTAILWTQHSVLSLAQIGQIRTPVLLITSSEDDVELSHSRALSTALTDCKLVVLEGVGHQIPHSVPGHVLNLIDDFLL